MRLRFPPLSSNRTCRFPASGFHVNSRHKVVHGWSDSLNLAAQPASQEKTIPQLCSRGFRRRTCVQAEFPPSYSSTLTFRPLRSTVVTRFSATMSLSDSRTEPLPRLCFPSERWRRRRRHPAGSPRFLGRSVSTRRPLPPRQVQRLLVPIASSLAFRLHHSWADWPLAGLRNEAESGSLALRLADSPSKASPLGLLRAALGRLSLEWAIERMNSFQFIRSARLCLAHPRTQRREPGGHQTQRKFDSTRLGPPLFLGVLGALGGSYQSCWLPRSGSLWAV